MSDDSKDAIIVNVLIDDSNADKDASDYASRVQKGLKKYLGSFKIIDSDNIADESASKVAELAGSFGKLGLAAAATAVIGLSVQRAFDFALQGEQIKAVNAQFDNLAKNAGLVPDELRKGLEQSGDGLVDMETLIGKANGAIINLGSSAARLPEVLQLSQKVAASLGGSIEERFSGIVSAIESGNGKALKAQGIYIDTDQALRNYAASLGLAVGDLDQSQKAQAILNGVLDQGARQYKDVATGIQPATDNIKKFEVAVGNISDKLAVALADSGPFVRFTDILADIARHESNTTDPVTQKLTGLIAERMRLQGKLEQLNKIMSDLGLTEQTTTFGYELDVYRKQLKSVEDEISTYGNVVTVNTAEVVEQNKKQAAAAKEAAAASAKAEQLKINARQQALILSRNLGLQEIRDQANIARVNTQIGAAGNERNAYERTLALQSLYQEKGLVLKQDYETKLAQIDAEKKAGALQNEQEYQAKRLQATNAYTIGIQEIQNQQGALSQTLTDSISDGTFLVETLFGDMSDEAANYQLSVEDAAKGVKNSLKSIAKESINSLGNGVGKSFEAFGASLVNGGNSLDAFTNAFLKSVGDMAVASGTRFILEGLAWMFVPGEEAMGSAMIAAGAALATFGGALGAIMANSAPNKGGSGSGGGVDSTDTGTTSVVDPENQKREDAKQNINVTIQGNVLDNRETGLYIAEVLREQYDASGVTIGGA